MPISWFAVCIAWRNSSCRLGLNGVVQASLVFVAAL
jgi:hypothetical protein